MSPLDNPLVMVYLSREFRGTRGRRARNLRARISGEQGFRRFHAMYRMGPGNRYTPRDR